MKSLARFLVPTSIASQIIVFVVGALVLAHVILVTTVVLVRPSLGFGHSATIFVGTVAAIVKAIDLEPTQTRERAIESAAAVIPNTTVIPTSEAATITPNAPDTIALLEALRSTLNDRDRVQLLAAGNNRDQLFFGIRLKDGAILRVPITRANIGPPLAPIFWLVASIATTLIALSIWAARQLTAPLTRFSNAAERFGVALDSEPLPDTGPAEIRRASAMFNQMRIRIRQLIDDRTRMLAAVSHDLRTPLTRLRLRIETMEHLQHREQAIADIKSMETMLHSSLEYLRWGDKRLKQEAVDLPSLLQSACSDLADLGMNVAYDGPLHLAILCDPDLLSRAIGNLLENAVRHGNKVVVRLGTSGSNNALIEIQDDGPGMSDREKSLVFEPFYRGDPARTSRDDGGFGLGLSIVKAIIDEHGGTISLSDASPHGLIVTIRLPVSSSVTDN